MYAKSAITIGNIIEAARHLFTVRHFADVTMSDIADAAEVTKGALYHHFDSKEDLYLTMMHDYLGEVRALMEAAAHGEGSARKRLHRFTLTFLQLPPLQQSLMRLVRRDINIFSDPERERLIRAYQEAVPQQAEAIIRDGIRDGEILGEDARLLAWEHVASVEVVQTAYARAVLGSAEEIAAFVIKLFFDGVAAG